MEKKLNNEFNLTLETITPLAINNGEKLSPLSDYFVLDSFLYYVDETKFQNLLLGDEILLKRYEEQLSKTDIDGANDFLIKVVGSREKLLEISKGKPIPFYGKETTELHTIIKSNNLPYVPGSTIKGAIKNVILFYGLMEGYPNEISEFINSNINKFRSIRMIYEKHSKLSRNSSEYRLLKAQLKDINRIINQFIEKIETKIFGIVRGNLYQPSSNFSISDSECTSSNSIAVGTISRRTLASRTNDWNLHTQEYIVKKSLVKFHVFIKNTDQDWKTFRSENFFIKLLRQSDKNMSELFRIINYFHKAVISEPNLFEIDISHSNLESNEAILYLGSQKGIFKNTVLLAIKKYYEKNDLDFNNDFAPIIRGGLKTYEDFPNSISHINNESLGMVKISDIRKENYIEVSSKSYNNSELKSGNAIEAIIIEIGKPNYKVSVNKCGDDVIINVGGAKSFLRENSNSLQLGTKCQIYWRDSNFYFSKS